MRITVTPDKEYATEIKRKLKDNGGYCPCSLVKNEDTKCMCKEFREMDEVCAIVGSISRLQIWYLAAPLLLMLASTEMKTVNFAEMYALMKSQKRQTQSRLFPAALAL